jgi:hypothetical protein
MHRRYSSSQNKTNRDAFAFALSKETRAGNNLKTKKVSLLCALNFNLLLLHSSPAQANSPTQHGDHFCSRQGWSICFDGCI